MAKRGRRRKTGHRVFDKSHPTGRLITPEPQGPVVPTEVMRRRIDHVGSEDAMTIAGGRAPSTLARWGIISERQRLAAEKYRSVYEWWRRTQGMASRHGKSAYYPVSTPDDQLVTRAQSRRAAEWAAMSPEERSIEEAIDAKKADEAWGDASKVIASLKPVSLVRGVVDMVCIEDVAPDTWSLGIVAPAALTALKAGLSALANHFGIDEPEATAA